MQRGAKNSSADEKKHSKDAVNRVKEREGLLGMVIAPRYKMDSAGKKTLPQTKGGGGAKEREGWH